MKPKKSPSEGTSTLSTAYHGRMPNEYYTRFKAQAAAESRSFSNLITKALIEWLDSQAGKKK